MTWRTKTVWGGACQKEKKKKTGSRFFWVLAREDKTRCDCEDAPVECFVGKERVFGAAWAGAIASRVLIVLCVLSTLLARTHKERKERETACLPIKASGWTRSGRAAVACPPNKKSKKAYFFSSRAVFSW